MILCKFRLNFLTNLFSSIQTRSVKVLPHRKPIAVYTKKDYEAYLTQKTKRKQRNSIKALKPQSNQTTSSTKYNSGKNLPSSLLELKYKKLRNLPGNVINHMLSDMGTMKRRPNPHLCLLSNPQAINCALLADDFVKTIYFNRLHKLKVITVFIFSDTLIM